jgi:hypothetical protein
LTYYVVAHEMGPCIFSVSLVVLPNSTVFEDASICKDLAVHQFKDKRGIYLNPWFLTGFSDGEACFHINIYQDKNSKTGWKVRCLYQISLHRKDRALLELIHSSFDNVGGIYEDRNDLIKYQVSSNKDLIRVIIPHFSKYPLLTQKRTDFELFKQVVEMLSRKEHYKMEILQQIVNLKASSNEGLTDLLKKAFFEVVPVQRLIVVDQVISDPNWVVGFTTAEGCFLISIFNNSGKLGSASKLRFSITQHSRDEQLLRNLVSYLGCGYYNSRKGYDAGDFFCTDISGILEKIIPFFTKYPILGVKSLDFYEFKKVAYLMKDKCHLTKEGLDQIRTIKAGMNKGRKF